MLFTILLKSKKSASPKSFSTVLKTYFCVSIFGSVFKYQKNYKTNYNQRKVDANLEADNNFEITIKTTDFIEIITIKNCIRVVTEHQLNSFPKKYQ